MICFMNSDNHKIHGKKSLKFHETRYGRRVCITLKAFKIHIKYNQKFEIFALNEYLAEVRHFISLPLNIACVSNKRKTKNQEKEKKNEKEKRNSCVNWTRKELVGTR